MGYDISLSASKLNLLPECTRCFYDANTKRADRPRGMFPSLPGGVDRVMKAVIDEYRPGKLPPHLREYGCQGTLWGTVPEITRLRNWQSGLKSEFIVKGVRVRLIGALDDLVEEPDHLYSPYDTKTKGDEPKDDGARYYQTQMDVYGFLLRANGMQPSGIAYLDYRYPATGSVVLGETIRFRSKLFTLRVSTERAIERITEGVTILQGGQPDANPTCEYCRFAQVRVEAALSIAS